MTRVVCVGSNIESRAVLQALAAEGAQIAGVVVRPPSPGVSDYADVTDVAANAGASVVETTDINSPETLAEIRELAPDYIYTLGWSQLFREELLSIPAGYVVGSHPSPLPQGRGRAPVPWTILQQQASSAVSLFRMDPGVDSGALLVQRWFDVPEGAYAAELYDLTTEHMVEAFCELYRAHASGEEIAELTQDHSLASYRAKRTPADGHLDFHRPAAELERLVRAVAEPYPGAYTYHAGVKVGVWRASLEERPPHVGTTGQILTKRDGWLLVQAGDDPLWIGQLTVDDAPADLRTFRVGSKFGYPVEDELHRLRAELDAIKERLDS